MRYSDEFTLIAALDGKKKPLDIETACIKLKRIIQLRGARTYSCIHSGIDFSEQRSSLCHVIARDFDVKALKCMELRYVFVLRYKFVPRS